ncbi:alpha/beta hydrolase-fold protein [Pedobacter insulae]|uniref:Putative esterase n=1 Tax=Pedobacter insulae TaxID=414048 RepID=A0A1I2V2A3_9SPHI|nr:alpha/beta hydrolase-fold protein [Pedobacter insulae]SFG83575.1 Putative esterase [Pedobacter insulae]
MKNFLILCMLMSSFSLCAQNRIIVKLSPIFKGPYSGRLMVYLQADTSKPFGQAPEGPAFAVDVKNWHNGQEQTFSGGVIALKQKLDSIKSGYYRMVAILDTNTKERGNNAPGNLYTRQEVVAQLNGNFSKPAVLTLSNVFQSRKFMESDTVKEVVFKSHLLSKFRGEPVFIKAGVALPPSYKETDNRTYPVVYVIPGWGGTHHHAYNKGQRGIYGVGLGEEKIYVFLNPETQSPFGLHAFVDSRVNGPWGSALINELMPHIVKEFKASSKSEHTFLTGQSTGGYGVIWLALHFPKAIGGCWATAPDPVDFSNFLGINIYKDKNYYQTLSGEEREIYFVQGKATSTLREGGLKEWFEGDGGQQQAFDAEFGLPDRNGRPKPLFNFQTGIINHQIAESWKPYDLALFVQKNWERIKSDASGKISIYAGENDNFLLQHSVMDFGDKIKKVGADIKIQIIKGADHFSIRGAIVKEMVAEMDKKIKR